jgi:hypothetical protein
MRLSDTLRELPGQQEWPSLSKTQKWLGFSGLCAVQPMVPLRRKGRF